MPKPKKFNIDNFVADAEDSVIVAAEQKKKERLEEAKNLIVQDLVQNATPEQLGILANPNVATATVNTATATDQSKGKRGRKKSLRTIERVNGKIVFLEKETDANLSRISTLERFDKQDIIRTALHVWLEEHYDGMMLDQQGRAEIIQYIQRTTTFEEV